MAGELIGDRASLPAPGRPWGRAGPTRQGRRGIPGNDKWEIDPPARVDTPPGQRWIRGFIRYSALPPPKVDIARYRLRVGGAVERSAEFSYGDLLGMVDFKGRLDFHCVTGWSVRGLEMEGVTFEALNSIVKPRGRYAFFTSLDGYTTIVPVEDYNRGILVLGMNGGPLTYEAGFPARPFFGDLYAWKSAKWLSRIDFIDEYIDGYWEERGYHERGNVWMEERFKGSGGKGRNRKPFKGRFTDRSP